MSRSLAMTLQAPAWSAQRTNWIDWLLFLIGLASFYHVNVIGELYPSELVLMALFPIIWMEKRHFLAATPIPTLLLLFGVWLFAQIGTDLIRNTPAIDMARGWAAIIVFFADFAVVYMLVSERPRRVYLLLFGYALGWLIQPIIQPYSFFSGEPWKFGYGYPFTLLVFAWIGWKYGADIRRMRRYVPFLFVLGLFSIYMNARSLGGFTVLSAVLIWLRGSRIGERLRWRVSPLRMAAVALVAGAAILALKVFYSHAAEQGWLGEKAKMKYEMQASGKLGLIIGGRVEVIPAVFAVMDSPLIGHGSWAKDPRYREYLMLLLDFGYELNESQLKAAVEHSDLIPCHSHILQAWVWAGVLGALFWLFVLRWLLKIAWTSFRWPTALFAPLMFLVMMSAWDVLFSPFGSMTRFAWAIKLTVLFVSWRLLRQARAKHSASAAAGVA